MVSIELKEGGHGTKDQVRSSRKQLAAHQFIVMHGCDDTPRRMAGARNRAAALSPYRGHGTGDRAAPLVCRMYCIRANEPCIHLGTEGAA